MKHVTECFDIIFDTYYYNIYLFILNGSLRYLVKRNESRNGAIFIDKIWFRCSIHVVVKCTFIGRQFYVLILIQQYAESRSELLLLERNQVFKS